MKRRITTAIATGAVLIYALTPMAFAATTITISGNGENSDNTSTVNMSNSTTVVQQNNAQINNDVSANADTGNNTANGNTGGDVSVDTGDASVDANVTNKANLNVANVNCCNTGNTTVEVSGNGEKSDNNANLTSERNVEVYQNNNADINNKVNANADTGDNDAKSNTGGDVSINTGDADVSVDVTNKANANVAKLSGSGNGQSVSLLVKGNGEKSDNTIDLGLLSSVLLVQENNANIDNHIYADADTGDNDAHGNTGGDASIDTGDATVDVDVDNATNFNWADVNCDCIINDVTAKVAGNGEDSDNTIKAELGQSLEAFQGNCQDGIGVETLGIIDGNHEKCGLDNHVHANADTGDNDLKSNTSDPAGGDPSVDTGDSDSMVTIKNSGNANVFGQGGLSGLSLPDFNLNLDVSFDLTSLLSLLHLG